MAECPFCKSEVSDEQRAELDKTMSEAMAIGDDMRDMHLKHRQDRLASELIRRIAYEKLREEFEPRERCE